jgi:hypothetical protein
MSKMSRQQLAENAPVVHLASVLQSLNHSIHRERIPKRRDADVKSGRVLQTRATQRGAGALARQGFGTVFAAMIVEWQIALAAGT